MKGQIVESQIQSLETMKITIQYDFIVNDVLKHAKGDPITFDTDIQQVRRKAIGRINQEFQESQLTLPSTENLTTLKKHGNSN